MERTQESEGHVLNTVLKLRICLQASKSLHIRFIYRREKASTVQSTATHLLRVSIKPLEHSEVKLCRREPATPTTWRCLQCSSGRSQRLRMRGVRHRPIPTFSGEWARKTPSEIRRGSQSRQRGQFEFAPTRLGFALA